MAYNGNRYRTFCNKKAPHTGKLFLRSMSAIEYYECEGLSLCCNAQVEEIEEPYYSIHHSRLQCASCKTWIKFVGETKRPKKNKTKLKKFRELRKSGNDEDIYIGLSEFNKGKIPYLLIKKINNI